MTDQEIDSWVEEHLKCPREGMDIIKVDYKQHYEAFLKWGKMIAHKFYKLGLQDGNNKESLQTRQQEAD